MVCVWLQLRAGVAAGVAVGHLEFCCMVILLCTFGCSPDSGARSRCGGALHELEPGVYTRRPAGMQGT